MEPDESLQNEKKAAYRTALRMLSARSYFSLEVKQKLEKKGFSEEAIHEALSRCREIGALNDEEMAARYVEQQKRKGRGPKLIALKLQAKHGRGSAAAHISKEEEIELLRKLLATRYKQWSSSLQEKQRAFLALRRRGFSAEYLLEAMNDRSGDFQ